MIRVLLVDDQALFREGIRTLLSLHDDLEVLGEAEDGHAALELIARLPEDRLPQVVLMDLRMPRMDGVEATRRLRQSHPQIRVLILTTFEDDEEVFGGLRAGAAGYLLKDCSSRRLVEAIHGAARGDSFLEPSVATRVLAEFHRLSPARPAGNAALVEPLSARELEVLDRLAHGASNREIAERLHITEGTVKNHITAILGKLGVSDRTRAALKARELGLV